MSRARFRPCARAGPVDGRARRAVLIARRDIRRRARFAADRGHDRSGGRRERAGRGRSAVRPLVGRLLAQHGRLGRRRFRDLRHHRHGGGVACRADGSCRAGRSGRCSPSLRWRFRRSSRATRGCLSAMGCRISPARCWWSPAPIIRSSICRSPRRCADSIRRWRRPRVRSGRRLGMLLWGRRCRSCVPALYGGVLLVALDIADRIRRLFAAALSHLHDRALRPIPNRTGRARSRRCWRWCSRALSRLCDRRTESARRRDATRASARARGASPRPRVSDGSDGRRCWRSRR